MSVLFSLFLSFFRIGLFSIGGGYAAMPLIEREVVDRHSWLTMKEFADIITISEMTPGPIAVNSATFAGVRIAGIPGALTATLGCIMPSCIIVTILAYIYYRFRGLRAVQGILSGLRPAVIALIFSSGLSLVTLSVCGQRFLPSDISAFDVKAALIFILAFFILRKLRSDPIRVIAFSGVLGILLYSIF